MGVKTHKNHGLNKEIIQKLYCEELLSDSVIGKMYGITGESVGYYRKKYCILTISSRDRIAIKASKNDLMNINDINEEQFRELYCHHGERILAKMFGCSRIVIRAKRKEFRIDAIDKTDRLAKRLPVNLTTSQFSLIYGSLLGDGGIGDPNENVETARFYESHSIKQEQYLRWKSNFMTPFSTGHIGYDKKILDDGRICNLINFRTHYHKIFYDFRHLFYNENGKHLPHSFEIDFDPFMLAVWYMDDGHNEGARCTLATCFKIVDVNRIMLVIKEKFDISSKIRSKDENMTIIAIEDTDKFCKLVAPYITREMQYKLPNNYRLKSCSEEVLNPYDFNIDKYNATSFENQEKIIRSMVVYYRVVGFPYSKFTTRQRRAKFKALQNSSIECDKEISTGHTQCSDVCLSFFRNIWSAKKIMKKSPIEVFEDENQLFHVIKDCIRIKGKVSDSILRGELKTFGGVDNFRPAIAKLIYNRYCPPGGAILDPSSGYGGRLMGFYASHASSYYGIDANADTVKNLKHMRRIMSRDIDEKDVNIHYAAFEDVDIPRDQFDLVFTSPPYFCKEVYSSDNKQSCVRYKTYRQWISLFLSPFISKSIESLKSGGYFVVNIADVVVDRQMYPVANDFVTMVQREYQDLLKFEDRLEMLMGSPYGTGYRSEPIFVFRRT